MDLFAHRHFRLLRIWFVLSNCIKSLLMNENLSRIQLFGCLLHNHQDLYSHWFYKTFLSESVE